MTDRYFFDTNVVIYAFDSSEHVAQGEEFTGHESDAAE